MLPYEIRGIIPKPLPPTRVPKNQCSRCFTMRILPYVHFPFQGIHMLCLLVPQKHSAGLKTTAKWDVAPCRFHASGPTPCPVPQHTHFHGVSLLHVRVAVGAWYATRRGPCTLCARQDVACTVRVTLRVGPPNTLQAVGASMNNTAVNSKCCGRNFGRSCACKVYQNSHTMLKCTHSYFTRTLGATSQVHLRTKCPITKIVGR